MNLDKWKMLTPGQRLKILSVYHGYKNLTEFAEKSGIPYFWLNRFSADKDFTRRNTAMIEQTAQKLKTTFDNLMFGIQ